MPVTRFTTPQVREEGQHWFNLLSGVYCTFTVCTPEGSVVGCVDVPGPLGPSLSNQTLKYSLLTQCNIRYWVVDPEHLPSVTEIRTAFLGDQAMMKQDLERTRHEGAFDASRANLQAALLRRRNEKKTDLARLDSVLGNEPDSSYDSHLSTGWHQNSFITPLDSRLAELR